jgi:hypothetical protein
MTGEQNSKSDSGKQVAEKDRNREWQRCKKSFFLQMSSNWLQYRAGKGTLSALLFQLD